MNSLCVRGLTKRYPKFTLENVSFSLGEGRIMGLIGRNGAGKSTTLKAILNLVPADDGEIEVLGRSFAENEAECKQQVGVVFGGIDFYLQKRLSEITGVTRRFYEHWDEAMYERLMDEFELDSSKRVRELSAGMRVKYMIALSLSHGARLLILDEPTSGLDPVSRDELLCLFERLAHNEKISILFSTHITSDLDRCADDITYISRGKVVASAEKSEFLKTFQSGSEDVPTLEEIMLRTERAGHNE